MSFKSVFLFGIMFLAIRSSVAAFTVIYALNLGIDLTQIAYARTYQLFLISILDILSGYAAERIGHFNAVLIAGFAAAINLLIMANLDGFSDLIFAETANAVALSLFNGAYEVHLKNTAKDEGKETSLSELLGFFSQWQFLAIALASIIGGTIYDQISGGAAFGIAAIAMLIMSLAYVAMSRNVEYQDNYQVTLNTGFLQSLQRASSAAWKQKTTVVIYSGVAGLYEMLMVIWPVLLTRDLRGELDISGLSVFFVALMLSHSFAGWLNRKLHGRQLFVFLIFILSLMSLVFIPFVPFSLALYAFIVSAVIFYKCSLISMTSHLIEIGDEDIQVFTYSLTSTISRIVISAMLIGSSLVFDLVSSFEIVCSFIAISLFVLIFLRPRY